MKTKTSRILATLLLLLTFTIGQVIVFAHTHKAGLTDCSASGTKKSASTDTKCPVCDQNSHVQLFLQLADTVFFLNVTHTFNYQVVTTKYQNITLLLSGNRGPPIS